MKLDEGKEKWEPKGSTNREMPTVDSVEHPELVVFSTGSGGIGKALSSTAVAKSIRNKYPDAKLWVVTPHSSIFENLLWIDKTIQVGTTPQLYSDVLEYKHLWLQYEPYHDAKYIEGTKHILDVWCDGIGVERTSEPIIQLSEQEIIRGEEVFHTVKNPCIVFQITGGVKPQKDANGNFMPVGRNYERSLSPQIMQTVINELKGDYGFIQIAAEGQPLLKDCNHFVGNSLRDVFALINGAQQIVTIDSLTMHAAKALGKKAICLFGATRPQCLGYSTNVNLWRSACPTPLCNRPNSFVMDMAPDGTAWKCPYSLACLAHDPQNIIDEIRNY